MDYEDTDAFKIMLSHRQIVLFLGRQQIHGRSIW